MIFAWLARPALWDWLPAQIRINDVAPTVTAPAGKNQTSALPILPTPIVLPSISREINFKTFLPSKPRSDVVVYTVETGDTLFGISTKYNLEPETLLWSNYDVLKDDPDILTPGQQLFILPVNGLYLQWQEGSKLNAVAEKYGADIVDIVSWPGNNLDPGVDPENPAIPAGTWLVIPGGHREFIQWEIPILRRTDQMIWRAGGPGACQGPFLSSVKGTGSFIWPSGSHITSYGNPYASWHQAIDIHARTGDPVWASDSGVVVFAGPTFDYWGYGNLVVIDHGNDWQTVYAHLSVVSVGCGYEVYQGGGIGLAGSTGRSTGPHIHFEIRSLKYGKVNPHEYLP